MTDFPLPKPTTYAAPVVLIDPATGEPYAASAGGEGGADPSAETLLDILAELQTPISAVAPSVPETLGGTNAVSIVKVAQTGAGTASIEALDSDELWDVLGWTLSFSAACILTVSVDDDDASKQYAFDIPAAGIFVLDIVDFARFSGNIGEPVGFNITAGNMKGVVYVRKHA